MELHFIFGGVDYSTIKMHMNMECEFDFVVPPIEDFVRALLIELETSIEEEYDQREGNVRQERNELRDRSKDQILVKSATTALTIDTHEKDSVSLPFQKVPLKKNVIEDNNRNIQISNGRSIDIIKRHDDNLTRSLSWSSNSTSTLGFEKFPLSPATGSSISSYINSPTRCVSPTVLTLKLPLRLSDKRISLSENPVDKGNNSSTILSTTKDSFFRTKNKEGNSLNTNKHLKAKINAELFHTDATNERTEKSIASTENYKGLNFVQEEFYWIIGWFTILLILLSSDQFLNPMYFKTFDYCNSDYRESKKIFDSDVFTFAGIRFRLTFAPKKSSLDRDGYSLLLVLSQPHGEYRQHS